MNNKALSHLQKKKLIYILISIKSIRERQMAENAESQEYISLSYMFSHNLVKQLAWHRDGTCSIFFSEIPFLLRDTYIQSTIGLLQFVHLHCLLYVEFRELIHC